MGVIGWMGVGEGGRIRPIMTFPLKYEEFQRTCGFVDIWYLIHAGALEFPNEISMEINNPIAYFLGTFMHLFSNRFLENILCLHSDHSG